MKPEEIEAAIVELQVGVELLQRQVKEIFEALVPAKSRLAAIDAETERREYRGFSGIGPHLGGESTGEG